MVSHSLDIRSQPNAEIQTGSRALLKVLSRSARALSNEPSLCRRTLPAAGPFSTVFVQVYKFWCYYWGLRLLTRPSGPRGGPFELLFPPLSPSAPSRSRLSLLTPLSIPPPLILPPLPLLLATTTFLPSPRSPPLRSLLLAGYATPPPLSCLFFLASSSVC